MSYDVHFEEMQMTDVGEHHNYTYNCGPMFRLALGGEGIYSLDKKRAGDVIDQLRTGVAHMKAPENLTTYAAMNPANGWGKHQTATEFLASLLADAIAHPDSTIRIS